MIYHFVLSFRDESTKRLLFEQLFIESLRVVFPAACLPQAGLRRVRHSGGSRNPEDRTGFRIKCGMTEFKVFDTPLLACLRWVCDEEVHFFLQIRLTIKMKDCILMYLKCQIFHCPLNIGKCNKTSARKNEFQK